MRTPTAAACLTAVLLAGGLAGCGGDDDASGSTSSESPGTTGSSPTTPTPGSSPPTQDAPPSEEPPSQEPVTITIEGFEYSDPGPIAPGSEITVENLDSASHTLTADGAGDFDVTIRPGESVTLTAPEKPGEYPYLCSFHSGMTGTLVVQG